MSKQAKRQKLHQPPEFVHAAQARRSSNAAGPHQHRSQRRQNHRASATANAVRRNQQEH